MRRAARYLGAVPCTSRLRAHSLRLAFFALLAILLASCEVALDVDINVESRGSGTVQVTVTLDEEAAERVPNLEAELRTADLERVGWSIDGPDLDDNSVIVTARKRFDSAVELQTVLSEITGPDGMFQDFRLDQDAAFAERRYELTGVIDLRQGEELFGDDELLELLDGNVFAEPLEDLLDGVSLDTALPVRVSANLPGEGEGSSASEAVWSPRFDDDEQTRVSLTTVEDQFLARLLRWVGVAAGALFGLSVVLGLAGWYLESRAKAQRPKVRTPAPMATRVPGAPGAAAAAAAANPMPSRASASATTAGDRQMRLVVLDPIGVLYQVGNQPTDLLTSFVMNSGSSMKPNEIEELHRNVTAGRMTTADFWEQCGVEGDPEELDASYLSAIEPRPGSGEFLREMLRREMPVACLTNDASGWSHALRERDNLAMIEPWIISAEAGVRKPDPAIYEALRRETGVPYEGWLLIDADLDNLDTAKTLGIATAHFANQRASPHDRPAHPVVTTFSDFFRR